MKRSKHLNASSHLWRIKCCWITSLIFHLCSLCLVVSPFIPVELHFGIVKLLKPYTPSIPDLPRNLNPSSPGFIVLHSCLSTNAGNVSMLDTMSLYRHPEYPNFPQWYSGPCLVKQINLKSESPIFSILVNSFNRGEFQVKLCLIQLLKLTRERWELIFLDDGSSDNSIASALDLIERYHAWPRCPYESGDVDVNARFISDGGRIQGDLGRECTLK